mmetsp:Transcript_29076/g.86060  ORF Transcript_29076/g.86060 Transcript_29076/m.86060 type:complete len:207 (-) Transcript_29076:523-1143(-)
MPARNPAHSSEMYDAPTQRVFPGLFSRANTSSEEMANSPPSQFRPVGRPPTATMKRLAVISLVRPFLSVTSSVWASLNLPSLFKYLTFFSRRLTRYLKLSPRMWFWMFSLIVSQVCWVAGLPSPAPVEMPKAAESRITASLMRAALCMSFLGMHPTLTHVPPSPHCVPAGDGFTKSSTATFAPRALASFEAARPPEPPPITTRSYS